MKVDNASLNWLGVRIMLQPGKLDMAKTLYTDCKEVTPNVTVDLLHGNNKQILPYSQEEIAWVTETNGSL
jgi:hypothetical protein